MSDKEKLNLGPEKFNEAAVAEQGNEIRDKLREKHERAAELGEKNRESEADSARHEIEKVAHEKERAKHETKEKSPAERRGPASKQERKASYDRTMREVRSQMSGPSRAFSSVIHNPVVEKVSDAVGNTVARPNAILSGAGFAFVFTTAIYLVARHYGYPLSGAESIASFAAGWIVGLVFDYFRLLILGKK